MMTGFARHRRSGRIIANWQENPHALYFGEKAEPDALLKSLAALGEPDLIKAYVDWCFALWGIHSRG